MAIFSFLFVAALMAAGGFWLLRLDEANRPVATSPPNSDNSRKDIPAAVESAAVPAEKQTRPAANPSRDAERDDQPSELPLTPAAQGSPPTASVPAGDSAASTKPDAARFRRAMNLAKVALASRDLARAGRQLDLATRSAAGDTERAEVTRLRALSVELGHFFEFVKAGLRKLQATDEIRVGDWAAVVVEKGPESLTLFEEGSRRDYTLATMPSKAALFVATVGANENLPEVKVALGAFQLVDPEGDAQTAARLWNSAAAGGHPVDELLPLIEPGAVAIRRDPLPERDQVDAAAPKALARFAAALDAARAPQPQSDLAARLITASRDSESALDQYVLLARANDLAVAAADARVGMQVADELARWFEADPLVLKSDALAAMTEGNPSATRAKVIARRALELCDSAVNDNRPPLAKTLADTSLAAARKSRDAELIKTVTDRRREITALAKKSGKAGSE